MEFLLGGEKTRDFQALWPGAVLTTVSVTNKRSRNNNNKLKHLNPAVRESFDVTIFFSVGCCYFNGHSFRDLFRHCLW